MSTNLAIPGCILRDIQRQDRIGQPALYKKQTFEEQAHLLKLITSNFSWNGVTLTPTYRKPFDMLAEGLHIMSGGVDEIRTRDLLRDRQAF